MSTCSLLIGFGEPARQPYQEFPIGRLHVADALGKRPERGMVVFAAGLGTLRAVTEQLMQRDLQRPSESLNTLKGWTDVPTFDS